MPVVLDPWRYDVADHAAAYFAPWAEEPSTGQGRPGSYVPSDPDDVAMFARNLDAWFTQDALPRAQAWLSDPRLLLEELGDRRLYRLANTTVQIVGHPALQSMLAAEVGDSNRALELYNQIAHMATSHPHGGGALFGMFKTVLHEVLPRYGISVPA